MSNRIFLACLCVGLGSGIASAQLFFDDFNRADGGLGANWTGIANSLSISSNMAINTGSASVPALSLVNTANGNADTILLQTDVSLSSASLGYVAIAFGQDGTTTSGHGLFLKVQGSGSFSSAGFYTANNTSNGTAVTGGATFFSLTSAFTTGRMTVSVTGTTISMGLDTDFNGIDDQTYTRTLGTITLGNQFGLGLYGSGVADNYRVNSVVPEPSSLSMLGIAGLAFLRRRRTRKQ